MMTFVPQNLFPSARQLALVSAASVAVLATPGVAQTAAPTGPYAVARAGVKVDSDVKTDKPTGTASAPALYNTKIDAQSGFAGELGGGYDFGGFRLEGTVGYNTASVDGKRFSDKTNIGSGRLKSLDLGVSAYVDLIRSGPFKPFVGGGIGASRVDYNIERLVRTTNKPAANTQSAGARINSKDWGFLWHLDAGAGYELAPGTILEVSGRYTRTSALDLNGTFSNVAAPARDFSSQNYKASASSTSVLFGIRQRF